MEDNSNKGGILASLDMERETKITHSNQNETVYKVRSKIEEVREFNRKSVNKLATLEKNYKQYPE